jgi:steroid delta-isomerase
MRRIAALLVALLAALLAAPLPTLAQTADAEIRAAFAQWTEDFNAARADRVCDLFAKDLIANFRGAPERGFERQCQMLQQALTDKARTLRNAFTIREIQVFGDIAIARVVWTQTVRDNASGKETATIEPGLDVLRKEPDGRWRIFRYLAFEE